jgi:hypothetical protein
VSEYYYYTHCPFCGVPLNQTAYHDINTCPVRMISASVNTPPTVNLMPSDEYQRGFLAGIAWQKRYDGWIGPVDESKVERDAPARS